MINWLRTHLMIWLCVPGISLLAKRDINRLREDVDKRLEAFARHALLAENFNMRLSGTEASLRLIEKRLLALENLAGPDGEQLGLAGKKTADLLEAAAVLRRDRSAAEARGMSLEAYQAAKASRPPPPKPPELPADEAKEWKV